jgi:DNA-binding NarL/FixJ family response regulator
MVVEGKTTRAIASELRISFKTAASHRANIMVKLDAPNAAAVVREAFRLGLV